MADKYRRLSTQIDGLARRIDAIEASKSGYGSKNTANGQSPHQFCALPEVQQRKFASNVSPDREELIRYIDRKWLNGTTLRYYFFSSGNWSGPQSEMDLVRDSFNVWSDVGIGLKFDEVDNIEDAEIRIGFLQGDGAWSYVGRDVIDIPGQHERTMNFGWRIASDSRGIDVAVHEIGHTLGFPHEHQNPFSGIVWDEEAVYDYFGGTPNNWPRDRTFRNVLRKLPTAAVEGSEWDPDSIMHYGFPAGLIKQPVEHQGGISPVLGLSGADIAEVKLFYPPIPGTKYPILEPFSSKILSLQPAEQANFRIKPDASREYNIRTFGHSDTVMALFEQDSDGELRFVAGDDDSGTDLNSSITQWLQGGKKYVLRIRLYMAWASGDTAIMLW